MIFKSKRKNTNKANQEQNKNLEGKIRATSINKKIYL